MRSRLSAAGLALIALVTLGGCEQQQRPETAAKHTEAQVAPKQTAEAAAPAQPAAVSAPAAALQPNPDRNAYFGETHIHTS